MYVGVGWGEKVWQIQIDFDEFFFLKEHESIPDLIRDLTLTNPSLQVMSITSQIFGLNLRDASDIVNRSDARLTQIEQYVWRRRPEIKDTNRDKIIYYVPRIKSVKTYLLTKKRQKL